MAVRLENDVESSRWYPGAGLYRNVHLIVNEDVHIPMWGTQLSTPVVKNDFARVRLNTSLVMPEGKSSSSYRIVTEIKMRLEVSFVRGRSNLLTLTVKRSLRNL